MKKGFPYIVIAILIAIIIWLTKCNSSTITTRIDTQTKVEYKWDTFTKKETVYKPKWEKVYLTDTLHDSIPVYQTIPLILTKDSLIVKNDSTDIKVHYTIISENPLYRLDKTLEYKIRYKEIERTITKEIHKKYNIFAGPSAGISKNQGFISIDGLYERESRVLYKAGIGLNSRLQPIVKAGIYWQIIK
jgi:hypothetical protein